MRKKCRSRRNKLLHKFIPLPHFFLCCCRVLVNKKMICGCFITSRWLIVFFVFSGLVEKEIVGLTNSSSAAAPSGNLWVAEWHWQNHFDS